MRKVAKGPSGPLQLPGLDPEASSIGATPEAAELPAVPPAPLAQKPPEKAEVRRRTLLSSELLTCVDS